MGNYSESELTQFASHTLRPVVGPKKENVNGISENTLQIKAPTTTDSTAYGPAKHPSGYDENLASEKMLSSSSLIPLKILPRGIYYAEAINAGKSRLGRNVITLNEYFYVLMQVLMLHNANNTQCNNYSNEY